MSPGWPLGPELLPDGVPGSDLESPAPDGSGDLGRALRRFAFAAIVTLLTARLLGELRSEAAGFVFVPLVLVFIVWIGSPLVALAERDRRRGMRLWAQRSGGEWIEHPGDDGAPAHVADAAVLRELGARASSRGPMLETRIWPDVTPAALIADARYGSGRSGIDVTMVEVGVDPRVGERLSGVSVTFGSRFGDAVSPFERWLTRWERIDVERDDRRSNVRVRVAASQDHLAVWELLDPAFLVQLEEQAQQAGRGDTGFAVGGGSLVAWTRGQFVAHGAVALLAEAEGRPAPDTLELDGFAPFLTFVGEVHRRVEREKR